MKQTANTMHSYTLMRLDYMLDRYKIGFIDLKELYEFVIEFRHLPQAKQEKYAFLLDGRQLFDGQNNHGWLGKTKVQTNWNVKKSLQAKQRQLKNIHGNLLKFIVRPGAYLAQDLVHTCLSGLGE